MSFFKYCWEEEIKLPMTENCPECNRAYNNIHSSKRVCFDDRSLQPRITVDSSIDGPRFTIGWGAKPASTIGWGARLAFMIGWEAESMKSQTID
jgi:hypothetical protein